jgi:uncharacterized membrane protein YgcG/predicted RNA-binding Zn-ribbon protein involved in translation (DUF1610 family)
MSEHDSPTGYSQKSADGIAETTCPHCGSSQVSQHPVTGEWTCLYCRAQWAATRTAIVSVGDENAPRGADIATGRVFVCPNCGGTQLKQDGFTGKWLCLDCRNEFLDVDARMVVVDAAATIRKNDLVVDTANLLSDAQEADLLAYLRSIESQLVVAVETVNTITENVEYYARRRAQELGVGRDDIDNGVYIVVVLNPRRIQIVAGNGVAPKIDATQLNRISSQIIAPKFKAGDHVAGLKNGVAEMLRLYTSPANSAKASVARPNGGRKMGRGCLGVVLAAITAIIGGCFGFAHWQARQPFHSYTRISAEGATCFDHYYVYDKQAKTHRLASKTAVPVGNCISEKKPPAHARRRFTPRSNRSIGAMSK